MSSSREDYLPFGKPNFSEEEIEAVTRVMRSGWIGQGPETAAFEKELAEHVGAEQAVCVNSCTSALFLSLLAQDIGPGDEVVVPSLTWCSTANAVLYAGATPVFCDVEQDTLSVSPATIAAALTEKTRAVIVVHYGGLAIDVAALKAALPKGVSIIEDAAHALGARYPDGTPVGSSGNPTCFSFYANKNLSTGDGGAIAVQDRALAERLRLISHQGLSSDAWKRFSHPMAALAPGIADLGYKMNFIDLLACIGRVQLRRQPEFQRTRLDVARYYLERLSQAGLGIRFQSDLDSPAHARHLFVIRVPLERMQVGRNELILELRARNIGASIHYTPLHTMPFYQPFLRGPLANADALMQDIVTLPIGASVKPGDACYVADHLIELLGGAKSE